MAVPGWMRFDNDYAVPPLPSMPPSLEREAKRQKSQGQALSKDTNGVYASRRRDGEPLPPISMPRPRQTDAEHEGSAYRNVARPQSQAEGRQTSPNPVSKLDQSYAAALDTERSRKLVRDHSTSRTPTSQWHEMGKAYAGATVTDPRMSRSRRHTEEPAPLVDTWRRGSSSRPTRSTPPSPLMPPDSMGEATRRALENDNTHFLDRCAEKEERQKRRSTTIRNLR
ncbi:hypothetical protein MBLNU459_g0231t1 [Dothideomycetes sp. NU459]